MFRIFRNEWYEKKLQKLSSFEQQRVEKFEQQLKQNPYSGRPLGFTLWCSLNYHYLFVQPLEDYVKNKKVVERLAVLQLLRHIERYRSLDEEEVPLVPIDIGSFPPYCAPYVEKLYRHGRAIVKNSAHVGSARGLDAANLLRRDICGWIQNSVPFEYWFPIRHNVSGNHPILYIETKVQRRLFERIYETFQKEL